MDVCFPQETVGVLAAESGMERKENNQRRRAKTIYPGLAKDRESAIVSCVWEEVQRRAEKWEGLKWKKGKLFSDEKTALEFNISF